VHIPENIVLLKTYLARLKRFFKKYRYVQKIILLDNKFGYFYICHQISGP